MQQSADRDHGSGRAGGGHRVRLRAALLALPVALVGLVPATAAHAAQGGVVQTDKGAVRGTTADGVESFRGIPYAAAPNGARRWKAPQPAAAWSGVRDASSFGNVCPVLPSTNGPRSETEDCLFINVQRPAGTKAGDNLPVHVFIHGGGLTNGSSNQNDEAKLVADTGVIGVSMNYRLGVFGFLATSQLTAEGGQSGNYGFLDQQAALRWVQRNIRAFGGKPYEVTIDGESAGAYSVCGHMISPESRGLFNQAMMQSTYCPSRTEAQAESASASFVSAVGCSSAADPLACLRAASPAKLLDASGGFGSTFVHGTSTFPEPTQTALAAGRFAHVPVLTGVNRDEGRTFVAGATGTKADYLTYLSRSYGARADDVYAHYPWPAQSDQFTYAYLLGALLTDNGFIGGCVQSDFVHTLAKYTRTYAYEFDNRTGPGLQQFPGYVWGAGHAAELAYIWPSFNNGTPIAPLFNAGERQLANEMTKYWGAFATNGRPRVAGQTSWPRFDKHGSTISLRPGGQSVVIDQAQFDAEHQCGFWSTFS
ncbi:para-nitrobenzyl esterase [Motilibacter peucedani]|uniref:Carboxylic ester hydrolase n=1 Tax=Motilibacter peucedani TaxID=598650 RepID=A0A420XR18_9ACTN|nr:carboxylesterase family protein [Motilibacter peucedani]RKS75652.1 para-nitrobenzyl esterase [Motilibacter peucedani]